MNGLENSGKFKVKIWFLILFAFIQFPVRFNNYTMLTYFFVYVIPVCYLIYNIGWLIKFFKRLYNSYSKIAIWITIFLFFISILWPIVLQTYEFSYILEYWRRYFLLLIKNLFLLSVYELCVAKGKDNLKEYVNYYIYSMVLYVGFTGLTVISGGLRQFLLNNLYLTSKNIIDLQYSSYFTRLGWAGWSGFDTTMLCTLGVVFACLLTMSYKNNTKMQTKYLILSGIMLLGNMFYGRTGLTVSLLCLFLTCILVFLKGNVRYFIRVVLILLFVLGVLLFIKDISPEISYWYNWAFSAFINFFETGRFRDNTGSVGHLLNEMYWMPDFDTLFIGDGLYTLNNAYYMQTDSGIMRAILYYGIVNYGLGIVSILLIVWDFCKKLSVRRLLNRKEIKYIFLIIIFFIALFEIKGETYYKIICILLPMCFIKLNEGSD